MKVTITKVLSNDYKKRNIFTSVATDSNNIITPSPILNLDEI